MKKNFEITLVGNPYHIRFFNKNEEMNEDFQKLSITCNQCNSGSVRSVPTEKWTIDLYCNGCGNRESVRFQAVSELCN